MAIKAIGRELSEEEVNAPDLDEGELDVEHFPLLDGADIQDEYLRDVWNDALALLDETQDEQSPRTEQFSLAVEPDKDQGSSRKQIRSTAASVSTALSRRINRILKKKTTDGG